MNNETKISLVDNIHRGNKLYEKNNTMKDLANFMEYPPNKEFFDKYFSSKETAECMNVFIKMYRHLDTHNPYEKIALIHDCINDKDMRKRLFHRKNNLVEF